MKSATAKIGLLLGSGALAAALLFNGMTHAQESNVSLIQTLENSMKDKRGVLLYVNGQTIGGTVTRIEGTQWVELRGQQYSRVVVRLDRVDAVAAP